MHNMATTLAIIVLAVVTSVVIYTQTFKYLPKRNRLKHSENCPEDKSSSDFSCPTSCYCTSDIVNCSNRGLNAIPKLPMTAREVFLKGNKIRHINCSSFVNLPIIELLDMSENHLEPLPHCAMRFEGPLRYLTLKSCYLNTLPPVFFDGLSDLHELVLSQNNITEIVPRIFLNLTRLVNLKLSHNKIARLENDTFIHLKSLRFLSLKGNRLFYTESTFAPRAFNGLVSLETLYLHGNEPGGPDVVIYPDKALSLLPWLQKLRLDGYSVRPLGPGFAELTNLTHLEFSPENFDTCTYEATSYCFMFEPLSDYFFANIKTTQPLYLGLSGCLISNISQDTFAHTPTLHNLDLSYNPDLGLGMFEVFSEGLKNTTISILNINNIQVLFEVPKNVFTALRHLNHTRLKVIYLERNNLFYLDPNQLPETLEYLSLHDNFVYLNTEFLRFGNLKTLNLSRQWFDDCDKYLGKYLPVKHTSMGLIKRSRGNYIEKDSKNLVLDNFYRHSDEHHTSEKDFCGNRVEILPLPNSLDAIDLSEYAPLFTLSSFSKIQVKHNRVLKSLSYARNDAKCISGPILGAPMLDYLDLSSNQCSRINPNVFQNLYNLKTLVLNDNRLGKPLAIDTDGVIFSDLSSLEYLNLRNNDIRVMSTNAFINNSNIRIIDLSENILWHFKSNLENAANLQILDLSFNSLIALSPETCDQLKVIKLANNNLTVYIKENNFICNCDSFNFLLLLVDFPELFGDLDEFRCESTNGSQLSYEQMVNVIPAIGKECITLQIFIAALVLFFIVIAGTMLFSLYHYKRWQWTYLYYVGKSRLHIGSTQLTYKPLGDVFFTFDQENLDCRRLVYTDFLPRLREANISHILGEVDFEAGPLVPSIAGAVVSTHKTLVLFSSGMFEDHYRSLEVNLAIMHELNIRGPVIVPVIMLRTRNGFEAGVVFEPRPLAPYHQELYYHDDDDDDNDDDDEQERDLLGVMHNNNNNNNNNNGREYRAVRQDGENIAQDETLQDLLEDFPPEISTYLIGQIHRCIFYDGGSEDFWHQLNEALLTGV